MSQPKPLRRWTNRIKSMFANLIKPQAETLDAFRFGVAKAKSCALNLYRGRLGWGCRGR